MTTLARRWTTAELLALPGGRWRYELVAGTLRVTSPGGSRHGQLGMRLRTLLGAHVWRHRSGVVFGAGTAFRLARDPDTVLAPDVAFVRAARIPASGVPAGWFPGAPDLAVEVLSPTDRSLAVDDAIAEYLQAGARLAWVVNPKHHRVTVHVPGATPRVLGVDDRLDGGEVVPGFACDVREIFE